MNIKEPIAAPAQTPTLVQIAKAASVGVSRPPDEHGSKLSVDEPTQQPRVSRTVGERQAWGSKKSVLANRSRAGL